MAGLSEQTAGVAQDRGNRYISAQVSSYTMAITEAPLGAVGGAIFTMNNAGATTFTIPPSTTANWPIGYEVALVSIGAGTCTVTAGGGVTLVGAAAAVATATGRDIVKTGLDTWVLF